MKRKTSCYLNIETRINQFQIQMKCRLENKPLFERFIFTSVVKEKLKLKTKSDRYGAFVCGVGWKLDKTFFMNIKLNRQQIFQGLRNSTRLSMFKVHFSLNSYNASELLKHFLGKSAIIRVYCRLFSVWWRSQELITKSFPQPRLLVKYEDLAS
jgi:hypothetical protein